MDAKSEDDLTAPSEETDVESFTTEDQPFIGVASQSKSKSVIAYYGIENHSKWVFTPLFRGTTSSRVGGGRGNNFNTNSSINPIR
jgi:hypothetical protein